jgi:perosamine synthetase
VKTKPLDIPADCSIGIGGIEISDLAKEYIGQVLQSNRLSYGPFSRKFETEFAKAHGVPYACFMNSGTDALRISLHALKERHGWQDGDEVLVPAVTFVATVNIVWQNNLRPVLVDVDPETYNMDPAGIERHVTRKTRAIIPVHLMGLSCDMDPIMAIARKHRLCILEDCCEAMFATYKGKAVGSFGSAGAFSTYVAHYLVTGVGGLATARDPDLAGDIRSLMNHGRDPAYLSIDDDKDASGEALQNIVKRRFRFAKMGYSSRCTEMEAALGLAQIQEKDRIIRERRANAAYFHERLKDLEHRLQLPREPADCEHMYMLYPLVLREGRFSGGQQDRDS